MVFSTNQVRQLYVVTGTMTDANIKAHAAGTTLQDPGKTLLKEFDDWGQHEDPKTYEFFYVNALGELGHSDIIHRENIRKITVIPAKKLRMYLPTIVVTNNLTASTDYTDGDVFYMNFSFPGFLNATDEEIETKTVTMRYNYDEKGAPMDNNAAGYGDWATQMCEAIKLAFKGRNNLDNQLLDVIIPTDTTTQQPSTTKVIIKALPGSPWYRGLADNKPNKIVIDNLTFENWHNTQLSSLPLENNSRVSVYGTAEDVTGKANTAGANNYVGNGKLTADLEYFCMGERGDQYRGMGWPNYIHTAYMINNPADTAEYDYLDIHFYFQGEGVRSDKSEKVLTLVATAAGGDKVNTVLEGFYNTICGNSENNNQTGGGTENPGGNGGGDNGGNTEPGGNVDENEGGGNSGN